MTFDSNLKKFGEAVDDAELEALLSTTPEKEVGNRNWIEWQKMDWARSLNLSAFLMDGIQYHATYYKDKMFVQIVNSFVPCGYFRYQTIETQSRR